MEDDRHLEAGTVFDVWGIRDRNWRKPHYPSYDIRIDKVGSALDLDGAERIIREVIREENRSRFKDTLHSFRIQEMVMGTYSPAWRSQSEYIYDHNGVRLDSRPFPYDEGVFHGRGPNQIRFREGDLCEVLLDDKVFLGLVLEAPPSVERARKINGFSPFKMDALDDSYLVLACSHWTEPEHVESIRVFPPRFKVSKQTEGRLRKAYNDYRTFPMRMSIADAAAGARLKAAAEELGWNVRRIEDPRWKDDTFKLELDGVPGFPEGLSLQIMQKMAWHQMDRILVSFRHLAGLPAEGRGYRLKRIVPPTPLIKGSPVPDDILYRL